MSDITIHWANRDSYNRHKVAVDIQDACNMRAIARELVKVVDSAESELRDTAKVWRDSAVRLLINKLESLSHSESNFSAAYAECQTKA